MVFSSGKLFGDNLSIINSKGVILNYPINFSVYPYHLDILRIKNKKIKYQFKKTELLNCITNKLTNCNCRIIKPLTLLLNSFKTPCVNIPPKEIFGENYLVEKGKIDEVYYLSRVENNLSEITIEWIDSNKLAEICTNILLQEWHGAMSILYTYSGLSLFSLHSLFCKIRDIFKQTFTHYQCYQIIIPSSLDDLIYQKQLILYFNRKI